MMRFLLNQLNVQYGIYSVEGHFIRRTFSNGFSYIATECKSSEEANRIVQQLNTVASR